MVLERKKRRDVLESSGVQLVGEGVVVVNYRHKSCSFLFGYISREYRVYTYSRQTIHTER